MKRFASVVLVVLVLLSTGMTAVNAEAAAMSGLEKVEIVLRDGLVVLEAVEDHEEWLMELYDAFGFEILEESEELPGWHYANMPEGWTVTTEYLGDLVGTRLDVRNEYGYVVMDFLVGDSYVWASDYWRYELFADVKMRETVSPTQEELGLMLADHGFCEVKVRFVVIDKRYDTVVYTTEYVDVWLGDFALLYAAMYCTCDICANSGECENYLMPIMSNSEAYNRLLADYEEARSFARTPPEGISFVRDWWAVD